MFYTSQSLLVLLSVSLAGPGHIQHYTVLPPAWACWRAVMNSAWRPGHPGKSSKSGNERIGIGILRELEIEDSQDGGAGVAGHGRWICTGLRATGLRATGLRAFGRSHALPLSAYCLINPQRRSH